MQSEDSIESRVCLACGLSGAEVVPLMIICERAEQRDGWGVSVYGIPVTVQQAEVRGRDVLFPAPVAICPWCRDRLLPSRKRLALRAARSLLVIAGLAWAGWIILFLQGRGLFVWPPILIGGSLLACLINWWMTRCAQSRIKNVLRQSSDLLPILEEFPKSIVAVARPGMESLDEARVV